MTLSEAIAIVERMGQIKLQLAAAPRSETRLSKSIADKHRTEGTAIAMVLAALPEEPA